MAISNQIIDVRRGDTMTLFVDLKNADGTEFDASNPGVTMQWEMASSPQTIASEALITKTLGRGITIVEGGVEISLSATDTDVLPRLYYHEMKVVDASDVATVMTGTVVVRRSLDMTPDVVEP